MSSPTSVQNATNSNCNSCLQSQPGCGPGFECGPLFLLLFLLWFRLTEFDFYSLPGFQALLTDLDHCRPVPSKSEFRGYFLNLRFSQDHVLLSPSIPFFFCLLWCLVVNGDVALSGPADLYQLNIALTFRAGCRRSFRQRPNDSELIKTYFRGFCAKS